jgi:TonB family protein
MKLPNGRPIQIQLAMEVMQSKLINEFRIPFPEEAAKKRISGRVVVQLVVGVDGNVKDVKAVEGNPILSGPAMDTVRQWHFDPTKLDGDPVEVRVEVTTEFLVH